MHTAQTRSHGLDTLRALAIVSVMAFHFRDAIPESFQALSRLGWMGVDLFFVLSGYLIGSQFFKGYAQGGNSSIAAFYRNRIYRVIPAYAAVLALYFLFPWWREEPGLSPLWQFATFTENFFINYRVDQAFSQAWSLCVEEHFYLLLPLIAVAMMYKPSFRKTATLLAAIVALGIAVRGFYLGHNILPMANADESYGLFYIEHIYYPTYCRLDGLTLGVALALIRLFRPVWWAEATRRGHLLTLSAAALIGVAVWLFKDRWDTPYGKSAVGTAVGFPILSLGLALLVASALSSNGLLSRFRIPGAKPIAILAYSLYLTHKEIYHLTGRFLPTLQEAGGYRWLAILACACLSAATILYFAVERPFLLLRDKRRNRVTNTVESTVQTEPAI